VKPKFFLWLVPVLFLTAGCPHNEYVVELQPKGDKVERRLTCWRTDPDETNKTVRIADFPADELKRLQALYPEHRPQADKKHVFVGSFVETMPSDVGGAGRLLRLSTSLGSVSAYYERFRGEDDVWGQVERRSKAAEQMADVFVGLLKNELGRESRWPELHQFLDRQFRHDLKSFALHLYLVQRESAKTAPTNAPAKTNDTGAVDAATTVARGLQYLDERGYFSAADRSKVLAALLGDSESEEFFGRFLLPFPVPGDEPISFAWLQGWLARRLQLPQDASVLAFAKDDLAFGRSLEQWLAKSPFYKDALAKWKQAHPNAPAAEEISAQAAWRAVQEEAFALSSSDANDSLTVRLALPGPPLHTDGKWDAAKRVVAWTHSLQPHDLVGVPAMCYAIWVEADEPFQKAHFGKTALTGEDLTRYIRWRAALPAAATTEWDAFLASLKPGPQLIEHIGEFQFTNSSGGAERDASAHEVITMLQEALIGLPK
jgi:hypothetical protein